MKKLLLILTSAFLIAGCATGNSIQPTTKSSKELIEKLGENATDYRELTKDEKEDYKNIINDFLNTKTPETDSLYKFAYITGNVKKLSLPSSKTFHGEFLETTSKKGQTILHSSLKDLISIRYAITNKGEVFNQQRQDGRSFSNWAKITTKPTFKMYDFSILYDLIKNGDSRFVFNDRSRMPVILLDENQASDILNHFMGFTLKEVSDLETQEYKDNKLEQIEFMIYAIKNGRFEGDLKIKYKYTELKITYVEERVGKVDTVDFDSLGN